MDKFFKTQKYIKASMSRNRKKVWMSVREIKIAIKIFLSF